MAIIKLVIRAECDNMNDKRFSILSSYLGLYTIFDDKNCVSLSDMDVCNLLNKMNNHNEKLKNENEELKQTNQRLNDELQECMGKLALKR